jgi:hypothetical protein
MWSLPYLLEPVTKGSNGGFCSGWSPKFKIPYINFHKFWDCTVELFLKRQQYLAINMYILRECMPLFLPFFNPCLVCVLYQIIIPCLVCVLCQIMTSEADKWNRSRNALRCGCMCQPRIGLEFVCMCACARKPRLGFGFMCVNNKAMICPQCKLYSSLYTVLCS